MRPSESNPTNHSTTPPNKRHKHFFKHLAGKRTRGHPGFIHLPRCGGRARQARWGRGSRRCGLSGSGAQTARRRHRRRAQPEPAGSRQCQHRLPRVSGAWGAPRRGRSLGLGPGRRWFWPSSCSCSASISSCFPCRGISEGSEMRSRGGSEGEGSELGMEVLFSYYVKF